MTHHDRDALGRFAKGKSGGRPVGAKGKASAASLAQIRAMGPAALQKLWEGVHNGQRWAVELVLNQILPPSRTVEFEDATAADVVEALRSGDLAPAEAANIAIALTRLQELAISEPPPRTIDVDYSVRDSDSEEAAAEKYRRLLEEGK